MSGRAKLIDLDHQQWATGWWFCQFHGRLAGVAGAIVEPKFCWHEYRHECELVFVHLVPIIGGP